MHNMQGLFVFAILAIVALAAAMPARSIAPHNKSFTVPRVRKTGYVRDPSRAMNRAYRKYGWKMSVPVSNHAGGGAETASGDETSVDFINFVKSATADSASSSASSTSATGQGDDTGEVAATPADNGAEYLSKVRD